VISRSVNIIIHCTLASENSIGSFSTSIYLSSSLLRLPVNALLWHTSSLTDLCSKVGRTLPYHKIYPKRPTASLVSKKVLSSIIGQIIITSAAQVWIYVWVRQREWYTPPPTDEPGHGNNLESTNYENSVLFLVSCFQYILVAAVFSIGPPYRKSIWTNGTCLLPGRSAGAE
jgi:magnesium-transporting ATPase (P-type)